MPSISLFVQTPTHIPGGPSSASHRASPTTSWCQHVGGDPCFESELKFLTSFPDQEMFLSYQKVVTLLQSIC